MKENILLITSEPSSANFSVLIISIRASCPNSKVYYIFKARGEEEYSTYKDFIQNDIYYFPYRDYFEESFLRIFREGDVNIFTKIVDYIYTKFFSCFRMVFKSKFEKRLIDVATHLIAKHNIEVIYTSNNPYHAHKVALSISSIQTVTWYQFWLDPFFISPTHNRFNLNKISKAYLEKKLIVAGTKILVLPEVFKYDPILSEFKNKVNEIEIPFISKKVTQISTYDIVFAGSFVKGLREPEPVFSIILKSINSLDERIRFVFYVRNKNIYNDIENLSKGRIIFYNYIPREKLDQIQSNSMALMSVGNINSCQMPSKVVEYIAYRKPILFFYTDSHDPSFRYFSNYPHTCYINVNDDVYKNADKLAKFVRLEHPTLSYETLLNIDLFRKSTPEYIASIIRD